MDCGPGSTTASGPVVFLGILGGVASLPRFGEIFRNGSTFEGPLPIAFPCL